MSTVWKELDNRELAERLLIILAINGPALNTSEKDTLRAAAARLSETSEKEQIMETCTAVEGVFEGPQEDSGGPEHEITHADIVKSVIRRCIGIARRISAKHRADGLFVEAAGSDRVMYQLSRELLPDAEPKSETESGWMVPATGTHDASSSSTTTEPSSFPPDPYADVPMGPVGASDFPLASAPEPAAPTPETDVAELRERLTQGEKDYAELLADSADYVKELHDLRERLAVLEEEASSTAAHIWRERYEVTQQALDAAGHLERPSTPSGYVMVPRSDLESMREDHIISGSIGPLYNAGWAAACKHWAEVLLFVAAEEGK